MYSHHLKEMAELAVSHLNEGADESLKLQGKHVSQLKEIFAGYWKDKIAPSWSYQDVIDRAESKGIALNKDDALYILSDLLSDFDAFHGINWEVIDEAITWHTGSI